MNSEDLKKNIKDSLFTGLISLALFVPIVGLRTEIQKEGLYIDPQWGSTFILVAICVIGRFLINLNSQRSEKIDILSKFSSGVSNFFSGKGKQFAITGIFFAIVFPFLPFTDRYILDVGIMVLTYIMLGWGLNIVIGLIETMWSGYVSVEYKDVAAFSILVIVLIFFPTGFLGKPDIEKV